MKSKAHYDDPRTPGALLGDIDGYRVSALAASKRATVAVADIVRSSQGLHDERDARAVAYEIGEIRECMRTMAREIRELRKRLGVKYTQADRARDRVFSAQCALSHAEQAWEAAGGPRAETPATKRLASEKKS